MLYGVDTAETIGALIVRVRADQGITQLRLAERLCASSGVTTVTRNEVSRWEREERIPSAFWRSWLAVALQVPLEQLDRAAGVARRRRGALRGRVRWIEFAAGVYQRAS